MGYSRVLAHYPYLVVAGVAVFSLTCLIVALTVSKTPGFSDPKLGFVARGTELSARLQSYKALLDETDGMLTTPLIDQHFISAADLGTRREHVMRNRTHNIVTSQKKAARRRHKQKLRMSPREAVGDNGELHPENDTFEEQSEHFFCDAPRAEYARYTFNDVNSSSLLTLGAVRASCALDEKIRKLPSFKRTCLRQQYTDQCCRTWSLGNYIALLNNRTSCDQLESADVTYVGELLSACAVWHDQGLLDKCGSEDYSRRRSDSCNKVPTECTQYGAVNQIFRYIADVSFMSKTDSGRNTKLTYAMSFIPLASGISTEALYLEIDEDMELIQKPVQIVAINFGLKDALFDHYLQVDSLWFIGALLTVIFIMWLYTQSLFLTFMTLMSIVMSLLISYCLYTAVYEIAFFPYMNLMAIVLLIGIGADDVFLYCRIWYLAKLEKNVGTLEKVVSDTLRHAALSMFVTSFTTAAALLANLVSNITALKCFAVFASTTIVVNFAMMLTWIPASIVIHDKWFTDCCFCYDPEFYADNKGAYYYVCKVPYKVYHSLHEWARIFFEKVLPYLVIKLRYVWLFVLGVLGISGMFVVLYYPKLKLPSTSEFQIFALTHPFEVYDFQIKDRFWFEKAARASTATVPLTVVWGVKATDTGNKLDPSSETKLQLEPSLNLATQASQRAFLRLCRELRLSAWYQDSMGPQFTDCFIEPFMTFMERPCQDKYTGDDFKPCCKSSPFPFEEEVFTQCLDVWVNAVADSKSLYYMNAQAGPRYSRDTNKIVALVVQLNSKQPYSYNYEEMNYFYNSMNDWLNEHLGRAPEEFKGAWFVSDLSFYDLQSSLAHGTPIAIGVSIAIATAVAFLTTLNVLITIWAMVSITAIVFVVEAILVLIGWELNIMEAVTLTVAVGLAMDFTLHYGMGYRLSPDCEREMRVVCSMTRIGSPVAMAALSTFLAGAFVVPSTIQAYRQLGVFLLIVMSVSWVYSTFFFQSLLRCVGPIGGFSQFNCPSCDCCSGQTRERVDKTVYTMSESTFSSSSTNHVHTSTSETHELEPLTEELEFEVECHEPPRNHVMNHVTNHVHQSNSSAHRDKTNSYESLPKHSKSGNYLADRHKSHSKLKRHKSIENADTYKSLLGSDSSPSSQSSNANVPNNQLMNNIQTGSIHVLADVGKNGRENSCDRDFVKPLNGGPVWVKRSEFVKDV